MFSCTVLWRDCWLCSCRSTFCWTSKVLDCTRCEAARLKLTVVTPQDATFCEKNTCNKAPVSVIKMRNPILRHFRPPASVACYWWWSSSLQCTGSCSILCCTLNYAIYMARNANNIIVSGCFSENATLCSLFLVTGPFCLVYGDA